MRRSFLLGVLTGLALGAYMRRTKQQGVTQTRLDDYYRRRAASYHLTDYLFLGQFPRIEMRKKVVQMTGLKPGDTVLDFACGTGSNYPYIMERIGSTGRLVGVDYSPDMLREAGKLVEQHGWKNVELVQSDAAEMKFKSQFDVVICTLGLAVIPRYEQAMERAMVALKPGGVFGVGDICESERWYMRPFNFLTDFVDTFIIADSSRRPWEWMAAHGEDYRREEIFLGYFYAATVRKSKEK